MEDLHDSPAQCHIIVKSMHAMCVAWVSTDDAAELSAKTLVWLLLLSPAHTDSDVKITNLHHSPNGSSKKYQFRTTDWQQPADEYGQLVAWRHYALEATTPETRVESLISVGI